MYARKNLRILYDAVSTLADGVGPAMGQPELMRLYMPPLLAKWQQFQDTDRELMPLMEAFTSLATALGDLPLQHTALCVKPQDPGRYLPHPHHHCDHSQRSLMVLVFELLHEGEDGALHGSVGGV